VAKVSVTKFFEGSLIGAVLQRCHAS